VDNRARRRGVNAARVDALVDGGGSDRGVEWTAGRGL